MRLLLTLLLPLLASAAFVAPLFLQCDPTWGDDLMGVDGPGERATICKEGCAMTSVSMALNALGVTVMGQPSTPRSLNDYLTTHGGYLCIDGDCNNLRLDAPQWITDAVRLIGEMPKPTLADMAANVTAGTAFYVAHVHNNGHFVLVTGYDPARPDELQVNDPFYPVTSYPYANITDVIAYSIVSRAERLRNAVIPFSYPLYKQCDPAWGDDLMVTVPICKVGCLMSSTSMAIHGKNITILGQPSNPGSLNAWLRTHGGYDDQNDLLEEVVPDIDPAHIGWPSDAMHRTNDLNMAQVRALLVSGRPLIANVMAGHHFVLVTGWDSTNDDTLFVNDPGFDRDTYSHSADVVGWRLYTMQPASSASSRKTSLRAARS